MSRQTIVVRNTVAGNYHDGSHDTTNTQTKSFTTVSGSGSILIVPVGMRGNNVVSITFNGVAFTQAYLTGSYDSMQCAVWYLKNPPIGTYNLTITMGNTNGGWVWAGLQATGIQLYPSCIDNYGERANKYDPDLTITAGVTQCLTIDSFFSTRAWADGTQSVGSGQTQLVKESRFDSSGGDSGGSSYKLTNAGSVRMYWTGNGDDSVNYLVMTFPAKKNEGGAFLENMV